MRALAVLAAACDATPAVPVANVVDHAPSLRVAAACPESVRDDTWARELFPGCPPMPLANVGITCARDRDCPRPCRVSWLRDDAHDTFEVSVTYDAAGRWLATAANGVPSRKRRRGGLFCQRDGNAGTCGYFDHDNGDAEVIEARITYDRAGRVTSLAREGEIANEADRVTRYTYDERLVRETTGEVAVAFRYDAHGRVERIDTRTGVAEPRAILQVRVRRRRPRHPHRSSPALTDVELGHHASGQPTEIRYVRPTGVAVETLSYCP